MRDQSCETCPSRHPERSGDVPQHGVLEIAEIATGTRRRHGLDVLARRHGRQPHTAQGKALRAMKIGPQRLIRRDFGIVGILQGIGDLALVEWRRDEGAEHRLQDRLLQLGAVVFRQHLEP